jgi:6-phosphogluconolactonase
MIKNNEIKIFADANELIRFAAADFCQRAIDTVQEKDEFIVALSGGNTPILLYDTLAKNYRDNIPWQKIKFYFGDERYVASNSVESNYYQADLHLFQKVPVDVNNIFRIPTEFADPDEAAKQYAQLLPENHFDLVYLGLGSNAHTASLMPDTKLVQNIINHSDHSNVAALFVPELQMYRISLTPTVLNNAKDIIFLVSGGDKASAVYQILKGENNALHYPAQLIHCLHGQTIWYLDHAAAELLKDANDE